MAEERHIKPDKNGDIVCYQCEQRYKPAKGYWDGSVCPKCAKHNESNMSCRWDTMSRSRGKRGYSRQRRLI